MAVSIFLFLTGCSGVRPGARLSIHLQHDAAPKGYVAFKLAEALYEGDFLCLNPTAEIALDIQARSSAQLLAKLGSHTDSRWWIHKGLLVVGPAGMESHFLKMKRKFEAAVAEGDGLDGLDGLMGSSDICGVMTVAALVEALSDMTGLDVSLTGESGASLSPAQFVLLEVEPLCVVALAAACLEADVVVRGEAVEIVP